MRSTSSFRRALVAVGTTALTAALTSAPAAAAACAWQVHAVAVPAGTSAADFRVSGTDDRGGYSGHRLPNRPGAEFYRWVGDAPVRQATPPGAAFQRAVDENGAGTVLVQAEGPALYTQTRAGAYTRLPDLTGYRTGNAVAINDRGEVLAEGTRLAGNIPVGLLWRDGSHAPVVVDSHDWPGGFSPADLDEDGTVLLSESSGHVMTWRDGRIHTHNGLRTRLHPTGISNGLAVGWDLGQTRLMAWQWDVESGQVTYLDRAAGAHAVNSSHLVSGNIDVDNGRPGLWRDGELETALPLPPGTSTSRVYLLSDNGTAFGGAGVGPLHWTCA
ncbi:hypothetical protein JOF53_007308 [Crossiella equi]|uniref:Extracellular repeat, HAF family n=1 Tax=Crossiella equi TaxID=130796 RepID=A0ABS5APE4_9PSEU|nr:hypothetical protein [Crossiella equi]MBP2478436.1 hypothetical protein [Crossiella equi]